MHWTVIGLAIALGVCVLVALELLRRLRRRRSHDPEAQVAATVEALETRLDELAQELSAAVGRAEEEARRSRFLAQIGATIDLDDAISSALETAMALPKADAAVVELEPTGDAYVWLRGANRRDLHAFPTRRPSGRA